MNKEAFKILKEINSLNLNLIKFKKTIQAELQRIDRIDNSREERTTEQANLQVQLKTCKKNLLDVDKKSEYFDDIIKASKGKIPTTFDERELNALNSQISNAENEVDQLQDQGLTLLDEVDTLENKIADATSFLAGSLETKLEIEKEINLENDDILKEMTIINERLDILHTQIPTKASERILKLIKDKPKVSPLAHISPTRNCDICGYLIPQVTERAVEVDLKLSSCPGCTRILIPQSTKF